MIVHVPASSANLGPGFDAIGLALGVHVRAGLVEGRSNGVRPGEGRRRGGVGEEHAAMIAFRRAGGRGRIWVESDIPVGRGLGSSGAVRVAGAALACVEGGGALDRERILRVAGDLEGHDDNVAASVHGGLVVTAAGRSVRVPMAVEAAVVVWTPSSRTSTDEARRALPAEVAFADATFNVGRAALLVAALAAGDVDALATATQDRLHQDVRLASAPTSRRVIETMLAAGAWGAWLSGSGPSVAALCAPSDARPVVAALPPDGDARILAVDHDGARIGQGGVEAS